MTRVEVLRSMAGELSILIGQGEDRIARLEAAHATRAVPAIRMDMAKWQRQHDALLVAMDALRTAGRAA